MMGTDDYQLAQTAQQPPRLMRRCPEGARASHRAGSSAAAPGHGRSCQGPHAAPGTWHTAPGTPQHTRPAAPRCAARRRLRARARRRCAAPRATWRTARRTRGTGCSAPPGRPGPGSPSRPPTRRRAPGPAPGPRWGQAAPGMSSACCHSLREPQKPRSRAVRAGDRRLHARGCRAGDMRATAKGL